ncbi:MAG: glycosyltransferase [Candidatus Methanomethylicaceae archaeon]
MKRIALLSPTVYSPMSYIRFVGPASHLGIELVNLKEASFSECLEAVSASDVVVVQREAAKHPYAFKLREYTQKRDIPLLFDLDDLLFFLPKKHPDRLFQALSGALVQMLRMTIEADAVTVCSNHLKHTIERINPHTYVIPNYIDDRLWHIRPPAERGNTVNILYFGTPSHKTDLASIQPALTYVLNKLGRSVSMTVVGIPPDKSLAPLSSLQNVKFDPKFENDYRVFVSKANNIKAHIGIAPLEANNFNMSKSPIKFLEYSCMGVAGIYSNIPPYTEHISSGRDGLIASNTDEWIDALITLIQNDQLRRQIVMSAQSKLQEFLLSKAAPRWLSKLAAAAQSPSNKDRIPSSQRVSDLLEVLLNEVRSSYLLKVKCKPKKSKEAASCAINRSQTIGQSLHWFVKRIRTLMNL